jgi:hypothetical protein
MGRTARTKVRAVFFLERREKFPPKIQESATIAPKAEPLS